tara:strand:- start:1184 stop:1504 length:321 start_codon:yes stop_codon:yes gene_type:complete
MTDFNFRRLSKDASNRDISEVVNNILDGNTNNKGSVTLTASATSTAVADLRAGPESVVVLMPTTANASAEVGAGTIYVSARAKQTFTLTHANNGQTDRTYKYAIIG